VVEVLSSRVLLAPRDLAAAIDWYTNVLGLRVYREYGVDGRTTGVVLFLGGGHLELTGPRAGAPAGPQASPLWLQVADVDAEHDRLAVGGGTVHQPPATHAVGPARVLARRSRRHPPLPGRGPARPPHPSPRRLRSPSPCPTPSI
jgi:catechol 2,3-dioxygenase-like lactoylglutathione lyase family enzyme